MSHPKQTIVSMYGTWFKMTNVLCSDGKYRVFTKSAENDTFFTTPGNVKVKGKTVTGSLWHDNLLYTDDPIDAEKGVWKFTAYSYLKNWALLPEWPKECSYCHKDIPLGKEVHTFSYYYYHKECREEMDKQYEVL